jgi:hypothetical protein
MRIPQRVSFPAPCGSGAPLARSSGERVGVSETGGSLESSWMDRGRSPRGRHQPRANKRALGRGVWPRIVESGWGLWILAVAGLTGLAIGALLGARAPSWPFFARRSIAALLVGSLGSVVGGSISLYGELTTTQGAHGLAAFVKGAIAGGLLGLILVGAVSWAEASSESS